MQPASLMFEIKRKIFHLVSIVFPVLYLFFVTRTEMVLLLIVINIITLYLDIARHLNAKVKRFVDNIFGSLIRTEERSGSFKLSGASFMMLGFLLTSAFFAKSLVIESWFILAIADAAASIVGIKIGMPTKTGKSLAGSVAFFGAAILVSMLCHFFVNNYYTNFSAIVVSCAITTAAEFYSKKIKINDNLLIPSAYCLSNSLFFAIGKL